MPRKSADVIRRFNRMLPCSLTEPEKLVRGNQLAHDQETLESHLLDAKEQRAELRKKKSELELKVHSGAEVLRLGKEDREVPCVLRHGKGELVEEVRTDTGEVIATRRMDADEAQNPLFEDPTPPADVEDLAS